MAGARAGLNTARMQTPQGHLWHRKEAGYLSYQRENMLAGYIVQHLHVSEILL